MLLAQERDRGRCECDGDAWRGTLVLERRPPPWSSRPSRIPDGWGADCHVVFCSPGLNRRDTASGVVCVKFQKLYQAGSKFSVTSQDGSVQLIGRQVVHVYVPADVTIADRALLVFKKWLLLQFDFVGSKSWCQV